MIDHHYIYLASLRLFINFLKIFSRWYKRVKSSGDLDRAQNKTMMQRLGKFAETDGMYDEPIVRVYLEIPADSR